MNIALKKSIKLLILVLVLVMFSNTMLNPIFAASNSRDLLYSQARQVASTYLGFSIEDFTLCDPIDLYNLDDKLVALCFASSDVGYIIVSLVDFSVPEFSIESNNQYFTERNVKYYYNGPLVYMKLVGDQVVDLPTSTILGSVADVRNELEQQVIEGINTLYGSGTNAISDEEARREKIALINSNPTRATAGYITGTVPVYSYNTGVTCGATAAAMYLRYYDIYRNSNYVPTWLETNDGDALCAYMIFYIPGMAQVQDMYNGVYAYLLQQSVTHYFGYDTATFYNVVSSVSRNEPYILLLYGHPTYGHHYVTGYGYWYNYLNADYAIVNDGWGAHSIIISTGTMVTIFNQ